MTLRENHFDLIIIGAGASGLMSACLLACDKKRILVLEKEDRVGRKLSATGNGRCNLTNMDMDWKHYYGDRSFVDAVLARVSPERVRNVFEELGVLTREKDGYVYPHSNQAQTVIGALYRAIRKKPGITLELGSRVTKVRCTTDGVYSAQGTEENDIIDVDEETKEAIVPDRFLVEASMRSCSDGDRKGEESLHEVTYGCDRLILATGGAAGAEQGGSTDGYELLRSLGHEVTPVYPGLTGMFAAGRFWKEVSGSRIQGRFTLFVDGKRQGSETGEIQITKTGVSGIAVFQLCRIAAEAIASGKPVWGEIDFVPSLSSEECERWIELNGIEGLVPTRWIPVLGKSHKGNQATAKSLKAFDFTITDTVGIERAQVSAGGVPTDEINPGTFESRKIPGLYILGELVDVDGLCGGYNLHFAWASAMIATEAIETTC